MTSVFPRWRRAAACALLIAGCALTCCIGGSRVFAGGDDAPVAAPKPLAPAAFPGDDVQDLLYLGPKQPILIRMHVQIDGRGFRAYREDFTRHLFASLDLDKNGTLEGDELKGIPQPGALVSAPLNGQPRRTTTRIPADSKPADGKVTHDELSSYVNRAAGSPFEITTVALRNRIETRIFEYLDANRDQNLSLDELASAWSRLRRNDINDDEILSQGELNPQIQQQPFAVAAPSGGQPVRSVQNIIGLILVMDRDDPDDKTAHKVLQLYDKFSRDKASGQFIKDGKISAGELGLTGEQLKPYDSKADGTLDREELKQAVLNLPPQLEVSVRFQRGKDASSTIEILSKPESNRAGLAELTRDEKGNAVLALAGLQMQMDTSPTVADYSNIDSQLTNIFSNFDQDNNEYVDKEEFRRYGMQDSAYEPMDRDRDGKVFMKEFVAYVQNQALLAKSRATFNLSRENPTLFDVIDGIPDGRLTRRELLRAAENIKAWDANGDGRLQAAEIPDRFQASLGLGQRSLQVGPFQIGLGNQIVQSMTVARPSVASGPQWYSKMDRNRDGDVSAREFLGPEAVFQKLDTDKNGLIDATEAQQAR